VVEERGFEFTMWGYTGGVWHYGEGATRGLVDEELPLRLCVIARGK
jgi:hypothetical protein